LKHSHVFAMFFQTCGPHGADILRHFNGSDTVKYIW
jgi:hypothetical protein